MKGLMILIYILFVSCRQDVSHEAPYGSSVPLNYRIAPRDTVVSLSVPVAGVFTQAQPVRAPRSGRLTGHSIPLGAVNEQELLLLWEQHAVYGKK
ncbi:hypothetical protein [Chitinivibrio alkaliphilus]|uniref:Uncharacterized protein n=1 Tax=Chitinivibrio alkaliphilus ACht1 TaxID=1313304 RepID=U7D834_9BACT|nr:hypothetical protein [Chitinivibrio alkaliphilus]ERP39115.1 hypothetical protein CALK_0281 [Chitinivibrio alkaliphilus ACht1]